MKKDNSIELGQLVKAEVGLWLDYYKIISWCSFGGYMLGSLESVLVWGKTHWSILYEGANVSTLSLAIENFLYVWNDWKINYFSKQPCEQKHRKVKTTSNTAREARPHPDPAHPKWLIKTHRFPHQALPLLGPLNTVPLQTASQAQEASRHCFFTSSSMVSWLNWVPEGTEFLSVWMQPSPVPKPKPGWVLRRPSSRAKSGV